MHDKDEHEDFEVEISKTAFSKRNGFDLSIRKNQAHAWAATDLAPLELGMIAETIELFLQKQSQPEDQEAACTATSWKGRSHRPYGPSGFNRCVREGDHSTHKDAFGNLFLFKDEVSKVIGHEHKNI